MKNRRTRKLAFEPLSDRCLLAANVFQNDAHPGDVNRDGACNVADLRIVFADLSRNGTRELKETSEADPSGSHALDVSGDGRLSLSDLREIMVMLQSPQPVPSPPALTDVVADEPLVTRELSIEFLGPEGEPGAAADFQSLIDLIEATIPDDQWQIVEQRNTQIGDTNLSLTVTAARDVQVEIDELLLSLKNLHATSIVIETRFITLDDSFFEDIGLDFDMDYDGILSNVDYGDLVSRVELDSELDIPFTQESFANATPSFGEFAPGQGANIGMAILSDIEVFFLRNAAQADQASATSTQQNLFLFNGTRTVETVTGRAGDNLAAGTSIKQLFKPRAPLPDGTVWGGKLEQRETTVFRNGIGRSTRSLMLMVTPRVIIQEEG